MKYSQAVLVACVGSAALVSALPHSKVTASSAAPATHTPGSVQKEPSIGSTPLPENADAAQQHESAPVTARDFSDVDRRIFVSAAAAVHEAKAKQAAANKAQKRRDLADEYDLSMRDFSDEKYARSLSDMWNGMKGVRKENKQKHAQLKATEAANKAAAEQLRRDLTDEHTPGSVQKELPTGSTPLPENADAAQQHKSAPVTAHDFSDVDRRILLGSASVAASMHEHKVKQAAANKAQTRRDLADEYDLSMRDFSDEKYARSLGDVYKGMKGVHKENKQHHAQMKADLAANKAAAEQLRRDLTDEYELSAREFEEELFARMFEQFRQHYRESKATRLQEKANKATAKAGTGGDAASRDLNENELSARMFEQFRQKYREAKAERLQKEAAKAAAKAGTSPEARDVEEELSTRMFEQYKQHYRESKATRLQEKANKAATKAGTGGDVASRDFDGELAARVGTIWQAAYEQNKAQLAKGKANAAAVNVKQRDLEEMEYDLAARDYDEELEMRDFASDDLVARNFNFFDALSAVTRTFTPAAAKGKEAPKPKQDAQPQPQEAKPEATPAPTPEETPAPAPETNEARDFFEELTMRDFVEINELD